MRRLIATIVCLIASAVHASPTDYSLLLGNCTLPFDPVKDRDKIESSFFSCLKGSAYLDGIYAPSKTFALARRFEIKASTHYSTSHAIFLNYYSEKMIGTDQENVSVATASSLDAALYQYGNPYEGHFRLQIGQQRPAFGINHFPTSLSLNQMFDPRYIWGSPSLGANVIYDSQKNSQIEFGWLPENDYDLFHKNLQNHTFTGRFMYDFSLNGSLRSVASLMLKKSGEKRLGFGFVSIGPRRNTIQAEWVRIYSNLSNSLTTVVKGTINGSNDGLNAVSYSQLIRLSYEDAPGERIRASILFDDLSFQYRLYAVGLATNLPLKWSVARLLIAFKQDLSKSRHRWVFGIGGGFQL